MTDEERKDRKKVASLKYYHANREVILKKARLRAKKFNNYGPISEMRNSSGFFYKVIKPK